MRVVLWLDIVRRMSGPFDLINRAALWIAFRDPSVTQVRRNAVVSAAPARPTARTGSIRVTVRGSEGKERRLRLRLASDRCRARRSVAARQSPAHRLDDGR